MHTIDVRVLEDLTEVSEILLHIVHEKEKDEAHIIALHGELGAGKTTLVQLMARELGITETVTSPTFVVMKRYVTEDQMYTHLVHIDAYRIEDLDEMRVLGLSDILKEKGTIICIEWAEKIAELLPQDAVHVSFDIQDEKRAVTIS